MTLSVTASRLWKVYNVLSALGFAAIAGRAMLPVSLLEVGARGGLQRRWSLVDRLNWVKPIFVEADLAEAKQLEQRYGRDAVLPVAAGPAHGAATLFVTRRPSRSSILRPDHRAIAAYASTGVPLEVDTYDVTDEVSVDLVPLDASLKEKNIRVDYIKTDVQGFDLEVLKGLSTTLRHVASVMCEVQLIPVYEKQACFSEVVQWMGEQGFRLVSFRPFGDDIFEGNAHFENRHADTARTRFLQSFWRRLYGISSADFNHSLAH